jgi:hypothetical protein
MDTLSGGTYSVFPSGSPASLTPQAGFQDDLRSPGEGLQAEDSVSLSTQGRKEAKARKSRSSSAQKSTQTGTALILTKDAIVGTPRATGYYPADDPVQGGFLDLHDTPLCTLQDHVAGKVPYVSLAMDKELYKNGTIAYGDIFSIPELDEKYGKHLTFKSVDTGSAFLGTKFTRIDICCKTRQDTFDPAVNQVLTLIKTA